MGLLAPELKTDVFTPGLITMTLPPATTTKTATAMAHDSRGRLVGKKESLFI
jgi:hypothetical protein